MDCFDDDPFETSSSRDVKVDGVHQLLEEGWFFGKLLTRKPRSSLMLRCYSDPTPNFDQAILAENNPCIGKVVGNSIREPSLLPCIGWREEKIEEKQPTCRQLSDKASVQQPIKPTTCAEGIQENRRSKVITGQPSKHKLLRTPSLPPCIGRKEVEEEEENDDNITMSRLIRQAMSPRHTSKGMIQSSSMPRYSPPRNWKMQTIDTVNANSKQKRNLGCSNQRNIQRSLSNIESQEVQGFKDLGFTFNKQDLNPSEAGILPGLQDEQKKNQDHQDHDKVRRRPHLSKAWHLQKQSCAPPIPIWAPKNSAQEMKAQLKYWARAVASNVR
ncbi:uncharacterized protein LOC110644173 [Hevea brasiliensis]|uniref:uncharacterized protein LOC110644173 n=1 Tax=Hevea brasiliensis TaxID=3981 RepID=UPI0025ED880D|nr:uncharacterized protein LOC110644173 [Hevea brasiliensis]